MQAGNVIGSGIYKPDYIPPAPGTGLVRERHARSGWCRAPAPRWRSTPRPATSKIAKLINVVDFGKAINPKIVETQISGAALMHVGFTMFEKMHIDGGQVTNASLADYKIPGFHDVPTDMDNSHVDTTSRTARSAPRASARSRRSACRRRSPTRSTTRSACG